MGRSKQHYEPNLTISKNLIKEIGSFPALYYSYLLSKIPFIKNENKSGNGYFSISIKEQSEDLKTGKEKINSLRIELASLGLISVIKFGFPAKFYFKIL